MMAGPRWINALLFSILVVLALPVSAANVRIGVVLLHGNGRPNMLIDALRHKLIANNILVVHPEMPFSLNRGYDKDVQSAVAQVDQAFRELKAKGATKLFLAGHSKGGTFAAYYAATHTLDGLIAISPGGSANAKIFRDKIGDAVIKAQDMIDAGNGTKIAWFKDFEGSRGVTDIKTAAEAYFSWYDPDGAMNLHRSVGRLRPALPILWIVARHDYPGLRRVNIPLFRELPKNPESELYEPDSDHKDSPRVSADKIVQWLNKVANQQSTQQRAANE